MIVACLQVCTGTDPRANRDDLVARLRGAHALGARFVATPEGSNILQRDKAILRQAVTTLDQDVVVTGVRALAAELSLWVLLGSVLVARADGTIANRAVMIADTGAIVATYDKIHMFDAQLSAAETYRESDTTTPGDRAVVVDTPFGVMGLSICYDVRFGHLYRRLADAGATILTIPAAFTVPTGQAHWHVLMRARAIETGCYVLAPAQGGIHADGRATYGHSLIVDPWGQVVAECTGDVPGVILADLDPSYVLECRRKLPISGHMRSFTGP
jgi:predicted amidohydrolase